MFVGLEVGFFCVKLVFLNCASAAESLYATGWESSSCLVALVALIFDPRFPRFDR